MLFCAEPKWVRCDMAIAEGQAQKRARETREVLASQQGLRDSIAAAKRLLDQSEDMLARYRRQDASGCIESRPGWPSRSFVAG